MSADCCDPHAAAEDFNRRYGAPLQDTSYGLLPSPTDTKRPLCADCWCDHYPSECTHYGIRQVGGRWLCMTHAALADASEVDPATRHNTGEDPT